MIWRPLLSEPPMATLAEMRGVYTLSDVCRMNDALDWKDDVRAEDRKRQEAESRRGSK